MIHFVKVPAIQKSRGLYKYIENKPIGDFLHFIDALGKSGNDKVVHAFSCCGLPFFEYKTTSEHAKQGTISNSSQALCNQPSSSRPHDSATESNPGSSGNCPTPMICKSMKTLLIILICSLPTSFYNASTNRIILNSSTSTNIHRP
jgi:hypothetical protein